MAEKERTTPEQQPAPPVPKENETPAPEAARPADEETEPAETGRPADEEAVPTEAGCQPTVGELLGDVEEYDAPDEWNMGTYGTRSRKDLTDEVFHKLETGEKLTYRDFAIANFALEDAKLEAGIEDNEPPKGLLGKYLWWKVNRPRHKVKKRTYILLTIFLGWIGVHRFYEKRYALGVMYAALFWSTIPLFLSFTDLLIAIPIKADEDGNIMI